VRVLPHGRRQDHLHLERFTKKGERGERRTTVVAGRQNVGNGGFIDDLCV
jgi:hypothetical protein